MMGRLNHDQEQLFYSFRLDATWRISSSSRSTTTPFCIRHRCSRADANAAAAGLRGLFPRRCFYDGRHPAPAIGRSGSRPSGLDRLAPGRCEPAIARWAKGAKKALR
jgi:hypothetical protein